MDRLEKDTEKYVDTDAKLSVWVNTTGMQILCLRKMASVSYETCSDQSFSKVACETLISHLTILFTIYALNFNSYASV